MSVAIVIPAYNSAALIGRTIASVRAQTLTDWHCYIVDDGSKDATVEVSRAAIADDPRFTIVSQENGGMPVARNTGRALALEDPNCSSLMFLDNDDLLVPHALATLVERLERVPSAVGATAIAKYINVDDEDIEPGVFEEWCRRRRTPSGRFGIRTLGVDEPTTFASLVCVHGLPTPGTALIRRSVHERIGGLDPELRLTSDWELFARAARHGHVEFVDEVLLRFRLHNTNASNSGGIVEDTTLGWHKILRSELNTPEHRRQVKQGYRALHLSMAGDKFRHIARCVRSGKFAAIGREPAYAVKHLARWLRGPS